MININNKVWDELKSLDIRKFLERNGEEDFFFEFKGDDEEPSKLMKEISFVFATHYSKFSFLLKAFFRTVELRLLNDAQLS